MEFIDLKSQYAALREPINARIQKVLDHGQYIMGPEVKEVLAKRDRFEWELRQRTLIASRYARATAADPS